MSEELLLSSVKLQFKYCLLYLLLGFQFFASHTETAIVCVPFVDVPGWPSLKKNAMKVARSDSVVIKSSVVYSVSEIPKVSKHSDAQSKCKHLATFRWKAWMNSDSDSDPTVLHFYGYQEFEAPPFTFEIGHYRMFLEVTCVQEEPARSFVYCYFNVEFTPLVAIIDGGSERMVQKRFGLILTTSRSKDPNMPLGEQGHMKASWSCVDITDNNKQLCDPLYFLPIANSHLVPSNKLNFGATLKITLNVWTERYRNCQTCGHVRPGVAFATIIVANESAAGEDDISIRCIFNCKEKVVNSEKLFLKVKTRSGSNLENYLWTYYEGQGKEEGTDNIKYEGLPSFMLVLKQNVFSSGKVYTIVVHNKHTSVYAKYSFETVHVEFTGNCSMDPMQGTKGVSTFEINCQNFSASGQSFTYEYFDKTSKEAEERALFSGRMLGTSTDGKLSNFRVTRGNVFVYIKDESGLYTHIKFVVSLSHWDVSEKVVDEICTNITNLKSQNDYAKMIDYLSIVPDVVPVEFYKSKVLVKLLQCIIDLPTHTLPDVKITSSTLANIMVTFNKPVYHEVEPGLMSAVVNIILNQAETLSSRVGVSTQLHGMSSDEITHLATSLLTCLRAIIMCRGPSTVGVQEFDLDFETEDNLMDISNSAVEVLHSIQNVLTFLQRPGLPPINITSEDNAYAVYVVINDEDYDVTNFIAKSNDIPVSVSNSFLQEFKNPIGKIQKDLVLRMATLDNIFWWRKSDVKSNLVGVSLAKYSRNEKLSKVKVTSNTLDVEIKFNRSSLHTTEISGITFQYQHNKTCSMKLDLAVKVHRLDPTPKSLIAVKFLFPQTNGSLKVRIYRNYRPECEMMRKSVVISEQSPNYPPVLVQEDELSFYYVGIIPGPTYINDTVKYTFQVTTTTCQHLVRGYWSSQGCKISTTHTTDLKVVCRCDQFSIFAAAFPVPPQEVDPFSEIGLFLTVFDNPVVVVFVSVVLLIYLIACLWAFCKDRKNRKMRNVVILDDNFPGDSYPYLLAVYTSSRFNAGTTAHVGIKIIGSSATSRAHILTSLQRKTLGRNYDDWFLMYYSDSLGDLKHIHIWHDNAGSSPDWFCDKIVVYDLRNNLDAVFVVAEWLALRVNCYPEIVVASATISQVKNVKRMFLDNCVLGLREGHMFLSIILSHPRSAMSTLQKISVLMCCVIVAMLCNIMFYSPATDEDRYNVGMREFYISIQSLVISVGVTFVVLFAFKKSYKYTYKRNKTTTLYKTSNFKEYDALKNIQNKETFYASYVRFVSRIFKGHPMVPVHMAETEHFIQKRTVFVVISWVSCIAVIVICSFFVMLYGLKLGLVKSKMWLSVLLFTVGEELFIVGPFKVLILALLLSLAFQEMSETSTHRVYLQDALRVQNSVGEIQYETLSTKRNHPMYAPMQHDVIDALIRKKGLRDKWQSVCDFVVSLCLIIVLSMVMQELWSTHYNTNRHVNNMVTQSRPARLVFEPFNAIRNITQLENYLHWSLFRSLYYTSWYNKDAISEEGVERGYWLKDFTIRKVGVERLRQIRVTSVSCSFKFMNSTRRCIPRWDTNHEDTEDYSVGWDTKQWNPSQDSHSPWRYTHSSVDMVYTMHRLYGESGILYHDGGYLMYLGPDRLTTDEDIAKTISNHWQDQLTSAVFVEFTLYNVNKNLLSQVTIVVEYLISGSIKLKVGVVSVESQFKVNAWNVLLAVLIIYYVFRSAQLINRQGLMEFLSSSRNILQVLIVLLGASCYIVAVVHYFSSNATYNDFMESGQSSFFDFDSFAFYFLRLHDLLSLLFCVAILRSLIVLRGGRTLLNFFYTLTLAASWVLCLSLIILTYLLLYLTLMFLLHTYYFHSMTEVIVDSKFALPEYYKDMSSGGLFVVKAWFILVMVKLYFVVFTHSFRIARTHRLKNSDQFNFITFIIDRMRRRK